MIRKASSFRFLRTRRAIPLLALFALFFGAWTPQGFMPMQTEQGFAIVLCSSYGAGSSMNDTMHAEHGSGMDHSQHDGNHGNHGTSDTENTSCTYAGGANNGLDFSAIKASSIALLAPYYKPGARRQFAVRNRITIPPATGPPGLA